MSFQRGRPSAAGAGSAVTSTTATPAPPPLSETLSFHAEPRPYKSPDFAARMAKISSNLSRRNKSLKQILQAEREAAMRAAGTKFKERKKKDGVKTGGRLVGAALKAFREREERERRLAAESSAAMSESTTQVPTPETHDSPTVINEEENVKKEDPLTLTDLSSTTPADPTAAVEPTEKSDAPKDAAATATAPKRDIPSYSSVEAPPSLRPAKKYCDVTGLIAPYTDPKSGLRYHSVEVYEIIKQFGPGVDNAYLSLRGDASEIK